MNNTISLEQYGPIISSEEKGEEIFSKIKDILSKETEVIIDFANVASMATFCAKQIFGQLYIDLGSEEFYSRVKICNANNDIKIIIRMGIVSAIS